MECERRRTRGGRKREKRAGECAGESMYLRGREMNERERERESDREPGFFARIDSDATARAVYGRCPYSGKLARGLASPLKSRTLLSGL